MMIEAGQAMKTTHPMPPLWRQLPAALLLALAGLGSALAAPPEVPDLSEWARLPPQEQEQRRAELRQRMRHASPEEQRAFRQQLRERLEQLSPEQRQALAAQTRARWDAMDPAERARITEERRRRIEAMSPEQRQALLAERRKMLEGLSPEERRLLRQKLPARETAPPANSP
jgi:hypothetical protein